MNPEDDRSAEDAAIADAVAHREAGPTMTERELADFSPGSSHLHGCPSDRSSDNACTHGCIHYLYAIADDTARQLALLTEPAPATDNPPCPGALNLRGEHFPCDWPTDPRGRHDGWGHTNKDAQALWRDDRWSADDAVLPIAGMSGDQFADDDPIAQVIDAYAYGTGHATTIASASLEGPHSRACGLRCGGHGLLCSRDCYTCAGQATVRFPLKDKVTIKGLVEPPSQHPDTHRAGFDFDGKRI